MACAAISSAGEPVRDDPSLVEHDEPVAELLGLVHVVGGEDEADALLLEPEEAVPQDVAGLRVEAGGRLVEQQDLRLVDERAGDRQPAPHAAGERLDALVAALGELGEVEEAGGPLGDDRLRQAEVAAVDEQVLPYGQLGVQCVVLRHDAEARADPPPVGGRVHAEHPERPPVGAETQAIIRIVDDLPAPLGPRKPNASPRRSAKSMPSTATNGVE